MKNNNNTKYGVFYKSQGRWVGPYAGLLVPASQSKTFAGEVATSLKSKVQLRRATFRN